MSGEYIREKCPDPFQDCTILLVSNLCILIMYFMYDNNNNNNTTHFGCQHRGFMTLTSDLLTLKLVDMWRFVGAIFYTTFLYSVHI